MEDLDIDGRIILRWNFMKRVGSIQWTDLA